MCQTTTPMARLPFRLRLKSIAVSGESMRPTFSDGDWLLFSTLSLSGARDLQRLVGRIVVITRESYPGIHFIKRVKRVEGNGLWVEGDNSEASTDSRQWGALAAEEIVGRVLFRYKRGRVSE